MKKELLKSKRRVRRRNHVRNKLRGSADCPRLSVFRSNKHFYCQLIDDENAKTIASASTRDKNLSGQIKYGGNCDAAKVIGQAIAERGTAAGIKRVRFDRGHFKYQGRLAALADAAREGGLEF